MKHPLFHFWHTQHFREERLLAQFVGGPEMNSGVDSTPEAQGPLEAQQNPDHVPETIDDVSNVADTAVEDAENLQSDFEAQLADLNQELENACQEFNQEPASLRFAIEDIRTTLATIRSAAVSQRASAQVMDQIQTTQQRIDHAAYFDIAEAEMAERDVVGTINMPGVTFAIEYTAGGELPNGQPSTLNYGRLLIDQTGGDGEHLDAYHFPEGGNSDGTVRIASIQDATGEWEDKVVFNSPDEAAVRTELTNNNAYKQGYQITAVTEFSQEDFQRWLAEAPKNIPAHQWEGNV